MNRSEKMNILYKLGFILMCVCVVLFGAALVCLILLSNILAGVLISAVGSGSALPPSSSPCSASRESPSPRRKKFLKTRRKVY